MLAAGWCWPQSAGAQAGTFVITPVAEKKVAELPAGALYWRIETFPTLPAAQAAASANPDAIAAAVSGKDWLFTLGPKGGSTPGGTEVAEIGPIPRITAPEYVLRINHASGPPGSKTPVHMHPGSETFYVLAGEVSEKTPDGVGRADAGQPLVGRGANTPMEVSSSGTVNLDQLVMFLLDASKPATIPATMPPTPQ